MKKSMPKPQRGKRVKGRGDYEVPPTTTKAKTNPLPRIESKLDRIEAAVSKAHAPSSTGSMLGRGLGTLLGQGDLGAAAGTALEKWFGHGDYELKTNSLIHAVSSGANLPMFSKDGKRGTRIVEREYLGDVVSSATANTFLNTAYRINPADGRTFPWLSTIALQYDEWEPNGIIFEFKTTSGTFNGTTQALGAVIMMTDYDSRDSAPFSKIEMENADYSCSCVASDNLQHGIECDPGERATRVLFTNQSTPPDADLRFCDLGKFNVATNGISGTNVTLGELWVSYDITFYKKQLSAGQLGLSNYYGAVVAADPTTAAAAYPLGTSQNVYGNITLSWNIVTRRLTFPSNITTGRYLVLWRVTDSSGLPVLTSTGFSSLVNLVATTTTGVPPGINAFFDLNLSSGPDSGINSWCYRYYQVTGPSASLVITCLAGGAATQTSVSVQAIQVPQSEFPLLYTQ